jgi:hypothetical protein
MKRFNHYLLLSVLAVFSLASCDKDDDNNGGPSENDDNEPPAGDFMATIGSDEFNADANYARYRTTGELAIVAEDANGAEMKFIINDFIGNSIYPITTGSQNFTVYEYTVNGSLITFSSQDAGAGSVEITGYNSNDQFLNGNFDFAVSQTDGSAILEIQGSFSDVPIVELEEPAPGEVGLYLEDEFYAPDGISADINVLGILGINISGADFPGTITMEKRNSLGSGDEFVLYEVSVDGFGELFDGVLVDDLPVFDYNEQEQTVSVRIESSQRDAEIWFREIPVSEFPIEVNEGQVEFIRSTDTIYFDDATYTMEEDGDVTFLTLEATNQSGNKVLLEKIFENGNFTDPADAIVCNSSVSYFIDQDDLFPNYYYSGCFITEPGSAEDKISVHFLDGDTSIYFAQIVANNIDYVN